MTLSIIIFSVPIYFLSLLSLLIPSKRSKGFLKKSIIKIAQFWVKLNCILLDFLKHPDIIVTINGELLNNNWYFLIANHQSFADIYILQYALNKRAPFLKFFIKNELFYFPIMGLVWWCLDYPFMKRYSKEYLRKYPEKKGHDILEAQKACKKFRIEPVTIVNFIETTRFSEDKKLTTQSPYRHLLPPRVGSTAFVLSEMNDLIDSVIDVTIKYDSNKKSLWHLFCGEIKNIHVFINVIPIQEVTLKQDILHNRKALSHYRKFIDTLWEKKDKLLSSHSH